jgi:hypothetical protein
MAAVTLLAAPFMVWRADDLLEDDDDDESTFGAWAVSLAGPLLAAQWVVVAFTREFDDRVADTLARSTGVRPEDPTPPGEPRVRVEWKWLRKRMRRRLQVFIAALPGFILISFVLALLPRGSVTAVLSSVLGGAWTFYWLVVGTASKSSSAWLTEGSAPAPAYIRLFDRSVVRWFARLWTRLAKALFPPAEMVERKPLQLAGLTALRLTSAVPLVSLWWRPLVPVAVASLLVERTEPPTP